MPLAAAVTSTDFPRLEVVGPQRAERDQAASHEGQRRRGGLRGDVADQARIGEHLLGVDVLEDHAAHPVVRPAVLAKNSSRFIRFGGTLCMLTS